MNHKLAQTRLFSDEWRINDDIVKRVVVLLRDLVALLVVVLDETGLLRPHLVKLRHGQRKEVSTEYVNYSNTGT